MQILLTTAIAGLALALGGCHSKSAEDTTNTTSVDNSTDVNATAEEAPGNVGSVDNGSLGEAADAGNSTDLGNATTNGG